MEPRPETRDLATVEHWDSEWDRAQAPAPLGTYRPDRVLIDFIRRHLDPREGQRLVELGAGNSAYLPGFAAAFGYRVAGLDYSHVGVELARRNLVSAAVAGEIVEANLFEPPPGWEGAFDVVFTMGVVEHFSDTADAVRALARYAAPGGSLVTVVPNLHGLNGVAARFLSRELYDKHLALSPGQLASAHAAAGLTVRWSTYLAGMNAWVANPAASPSRWRRAAYLPFLVLTRVLWALEEWVRPLPSSRLLSPWVVVVAETDPRSPTIDHAPQDGARVGDPERGDV